MARLLPGRAAVVAHAWTSPVRRTFAGESLLSAPLDEIQAVARDLDALFEGDAEELAEARRGARPRARPRGAVRRAGGERRGLARPRRRRGVRARGADRRRLARARRAGRDRARLRLRGARAQRRPAGAGDPRGLAACARSCSTGSAGRSRGGAAGAAAGTGRAAPPRARVRGVPHRPARARRRAAGRRCPVVPGHQIVGTGRGRRGERVGVPWLGWTCGECALLPQRAREPVRRAPASRAATVDGGYAEYAVADERFCFPLPAGYPDAAGRAAAVRRADRLPRAAHGGRRARGSGSTASAPPRTSSARSRATRGGGCSPSRGRATTTAQAFARELGAEWAGDRTTRPPEALDAAIIFAPVGALVPAALRACAAAARSSAPAST